MTKSKVFCGAALVLALLLVGIFIASNSANAAIAPLKSLPPGRGPNTTRIPANQIFVAGVPAIPVHMASGGIANNASTPAFTQDDVIAYLNQSGFPSGPLVAGAHLKILTIQFVTAKRASNLMAGEFVGRPDDSLVCYVRVQGPFTLANIRMRKGDKQTQAEIGDMVFDAHTGNLIMWGFY